MYFGTFANTAKAPTIQVGGQSFSPTQVQTVAYDSSFTHNISGTQLTLSADTSIPNGTVTGGSLTVNGALTCDSLTVTQGLPGGGGSGVSTTFTHSSGAHDYTAVSGFNTASTGQIYVAGVPEGSAYSNTYVTYERKAGSVYLDFTVTPWGGYFDVYAVESGQSYQYITRMQANVPGGAGSLSRISILSGDQYPTKTHVKIVCLKGELSIKGIHFRDNV